MLARSASEPGRPLASHSHNVALGRTGKLGGAKPGRTAGGVGRLHSTEETSNKTGDEPVAERMEGRRPVGGKTCRDACSGLRAGNSTSLK